MKWPKRLAHYTRLTKALEDFAKTVAPLPGITGPAERDALSMQIIASIRREDYFRLIQRRGPIPMSRADPSNSAFEAELGVVHYLQQGQFDEAAWLIFLMVYLAKPTEGWTRLRDIYGKLGAGIWSWAAVSVDPRGFERWLATHWTQIRGKFGNHRKYESIDPSKARPMGPAIVEYVNWVMGNGGHAHLFGTIIRKAGNDPHVIFDTFFHALPIKGFGRLGRFDWVAMLARYEMIPAEAGSAYLKGATGPDSGARLLFLGNSKAGGSTTDLQGRLNLLGRHLGVGMEVLEDAICNWQKQPKKFIHFRG